MLRVDNSILTENREHCAKLLLNYLEKSPKVDIDAIINLGD